MRDLNEIVSKDGAGYGRRKPLDAVKGRDSEY
jgi:hypothetical protein